MSKGYYIQKLRFSRMSKPNRQPQTVKNAPKRKPPRSGFATSWK